MNNEDKILAMLEQVQGQLNRLEVKVDEGFDRLEDSINAAAADARKTEKKLLEHLEEPHIA